MGDGQHTWAAAEWIIMMRYLFVREESDRLILCSGLQKDWLTDGQLLEFGPAPTEFGSIHVHVRARSDCVVVNFEGGWHRKPSAIQISPPGFESVTLLEGEPAGEFRLKLLT
jgi:hypothetical protein